MFIKIKKPAEGISRLFDFNNMVNYNPESA